MLTWRPLTKRNVIYLRELIQREQSRIRRLDETLVHLSSISDDDDPRRVIVRRELSQLHNEVFLALGLPLTPNLESAFQEVESAVARLAAVAHRLGIEIC